MSSTAIKWARSQNFGSAVLKSVVNILAARADKSGATWAAQATLAQDIGISDRSLRTHLKALERLGVIHRQCRSKGRYGRTSDIITLALHRQFNLAPRDLKGGREAPAAESSNRKISVFPTGRRFPGNSKRTTYPLIQGGNLSGLGADNANGKRPPLVVVNGGYVFPGFGEDEL